MLRLNTYIPKTKLSSHKLYFFGLLFWVNAKKTYTDQTMLHTYLLCLKRNVSQTLKSCKKSFPNVYIANTFCFDKCFLFVVITGSHFLCTFIVTQWFGATAMMPVLRNKCFKRIPYFLSVISTKNITILLIPKQRSKISFCFLDVLNKIHCGHRVFSVSVC